MDNFLDIAIIGASFNSYICNVIANTIITNKDQKNLAWKLLVIFFSLFNIIALVFSSHFNLITLAIVITIILFIAIYFHLLAKCSLYLICYYLVNVLLVYFSPYLLFYQGIVLVNYPLGIFSYLLYPILLLGILHLLITIKKRLKSASYEYEVEIRVENNKFRLKGYLDSGNTLLINNCPVIFLTKKYDFLLNKQDSKYNINIATIIGEEKLENSVKGIISIKRRKSKLTYDVIISIINNRKHFHGYDCLLNLNLIG